MALQDPLERLLLLQRDLIAFSENRLPRLDRLRYQLDASADDLKRLLNRKRKNEASRAILSPNTTPTHSTLKIDDQEYEVRPEFRQCALQVADELDLDELDAAKLCIQSQPTGGDAQISTQVFCALLRYHEQRRALLDCVRRLLQLGADLESDDERIDGFKDVVRALVNDKRSGPGDDSTFWRRCVEGLKDVEVYLKKLNDHKQMILMTGQTLSEIADEALYAERLMLAEQHESLSSVLSYLIRGSFVRTEDYRTFLVHAATLDTDADFTIHYIPILISGAAYFACEGTTSEDDSHELHKLFAAGASQLKWKHTTLKAVATVCWLAEYNSRFPSSDDADAKGGQGTRSKLFYDALIDKAFHYLLSAVAFLRPVLWYDPSRIAITEFLIDSVGLVPAHTPRASQEFALFAAREIQAFTDAFITNMPDILRKLKQDEDDKRRNALPQDLGNAHQADLGLERFIVIMAFSYDGDSDAARDFWSDRESNLYGFLRWASQRLPTPRVAAFCQLLRALACDAQSANHVHRFLLEDVAMSSGRLRKAHAVSWAQIFIELEVFAASLQPREKEQSNFIDEPETGIMLDAYLGLTAHICHTSPEARGWLLREQPFHLGDMMFKLANSNTLARVQACCLDVLSSLLADSVLEVRNGTWVLLDNWNTSSSKDETAVIPASSAKQFESAKQHLQAFSKHSEVGSSLVRLLIALVTPLADDPTFSLGCLPFPENLGSPYRMAGIDTYVDFVLDTIFARKAPQMLLEGESSLVDVTRFNCLDFAYICLSTFNEDLVLLANISSVSVEEVMETKSLSSYVRLHPFARVMSWLFDPNVVTSLFASIRRHFEYLNGARPDSPLVLSTLKSLQVLNLAWRLQPTYTDIVRPLVTAAAASRAQVQPSVTFSSVDEIFLSHLDAIVDIATYTTSRHIDIALESTALLQKIGGSRLLAREPNVASHRARRGTRIASLLADVAPALSMQLCQDFVIESWDLETDGVPLKLVKAKALLQLLNASLDLASARAGIAHCLLGFDCTDGDVRILANSGISEGRALFNGLVQCAAQLPGAIDDSNVSWLNSTKYDCLKVVQSLIESPLTSAMVQTELRRIDFLPAFACTQVPANLIPLWHGKDVQDPSLLLDESAAALRDFIYVRAAYFELSAADLRVAAEQRLYSVQEKVVGMLLGSLAPASLGTPNGTSVLDLFDFYDLESSAAFEANCMYMKDVDFAACLKEDETGRTSYDIRMAEELLILQKRELTDKGAIKDVPEQQIDDEIGAMIASLTSLNNWSAIRTARLHALEAWTDLMSLIITSGGLGSKAIVGLALQALLVVLPRLERGLVDSLEAAALLAKLALTLTSAISAALREEPKQTANVVIERLLASFRVSVKAVTDSNTDSIIRDVCYRTSCAILTVFPTTAIAGAGTPPTSTKQLISLVQNAGERLLAVVTEDAFSGRGVTRVSALLFLDGLLTLYQSTKTSPVLLRALTKLNFIPVLIDSTIGNISALFPSSNSVTASSSYDEILTARAYYHSALALLLRIAHQSADGAQLVLNAGFVDAVSDSRLFSTDPDIGLLDDADQPSALKDFYRICAAALRVLTAITIVKGPSMGLEFLTTNRWSMMAVFKKSSATGGGAEKTREEVGEVSLEFSRLILATGFLEDDAPEEDAKLTGFT